MIVRGLPCNKKGQAKLICDYKAGDTEIKLDSGAEFPQTGVDGFFYVSVNAGDCCQLLKVTATDGGVFTVESNDLAFEGCVPAGATVLYTFCDPEIIMQMIPALCVRRPLYIDQEGCIALDCSLLKPLLDEC